MMRELVAELRASGVRYHKDTAYKTTRRMTGRTGRSDWAEFEQVEPGRLRLRPGVAAVGAGWEQAVTVAGAMATQGLPGHRRPRRLS